MPSDAGHGEMVLENIRSIIRMEEEHEEERRPIDRVADAISAFVGTTTFVVLHLAVLAVWALLNLGIVPGLPAFDPYPFAFIATIFSMEGVLLSTFVLMKQNRMSKRSDRRNHLDLQINLLTEKEVTKVIQMLEVITGHLGVSHAFDGDAQALSRETAVSDLADELKRSIPEDK